MQNDPTSKSSKNIIPLVIEMIHPNVDAEAYNNLKKSFEFNSRKILVCYECFYNIVKAKRTSGGLKLDWDALKQNQEAKFKSLDKSEKLKKVKKENGMDVSNNFLFKY